MEAMFGGGGPQMTQAEMEALQAQQQQLQQLTMLKDGMRSYNRVVKECAPSRLPFPAPPCAAAAPALTRAAAQLLRALPHRLPREGALRSPLSLSPQAEPWLAGRWLRRSLRRRSWSA